MEEIDLLKEKIKQLEKEITEIKNNDCENIKLTISNYLIEFTK